MIPWAFERVIREDGLFCHYTSTYHVFPSTPKKELVSTDNIDALSKEWVQCIPQRNMDSPFSKLLFMESFVYDASIAEIKGTLNLVAIY
jgi:hypothetical protein